MRGILGELGFFVFCVVVFCMVLCESVVDFINVLYIVV